MSPETGCGIEASALGGASGLFFVLWLWVPVYATGQAIGAISPRNRSTVGC